MSLEIRIEMKKIYRAEIWVKILNAFEMCPFLFKLNFTKSCAFRGMHRFSYFFIAELIYTLSYQLTNTVPSSMPE